MLQTLYIIYLVFALVYVSVTEQQSLKYTDGYRSSCKFHQSGNVNLILSAPHGGSLMPDDVPDRTSGGCRRSGSSCTWIYNDKCLDGTRCTTTTVQDSLSDEFAANVADELNQEYNLKPFVVIGQWSRKKVDFNREINEASLNHPEAMKAHQSYHMNLQNAIDQIQQQYGTGLLIDVHGQGVGNFTMVGYLLKAELLNRDDLQTTLSTITSIEQLCVSDRNECIRGPTSFGTIFEKNELGIAYPSMANPKPGNGTFYEGGYITRNYISKINAIQTELPYSMRTGPYKKLNAIRYARALVDYMKANNLLVSGGSKIFVSGGASIGMGATEIKKTCYGLVLGSFLLRKFFFRMGAIAPSVLP